MTRPPHTDAEAATSDSREQLLNLIAEHIHAAQCGCPDYHNKDTDPLYRHTANTVLDALTAAGRLLPEGGQRTVHTNWPIASDRRFTYQRVIEWPDGSRWTGPLLDTHPDAGVPATSKDQQ